MSVVIPARNVERTIGATLAALADQTYAGPWEVVVADNGSTDGTRGAIAAWADRFPALRVVDASDRRGVAHARNVGAAAARGARILICDADDVPAPEWVERMAAALEDHALVTGHQELRRFNRPEQYAWTGDADPDDAPRGYGFLPYASGGNLGMRREVFDALAGFDESLLLAEDIDFGWRAYYAGYAVHFVADARIHGHMRSDLRSLAKVRFRGGLAEPALYRRHRRRGMPRTERDELLDQYRWLVRTAPQVLADPARRYQWTAHAAMRAGRVVGSVRHRVRFL